MKPAYLARIPDAEAAIRATGDRLTQPRVAVLATLLATDHAISHLDVTDAIARHHPVDRVTVYRVLEWLVTIGIAHRIAGDDRVWRFMLSPRKTVGSVIHRTNISTHTLRVTIVGKPFVWTRYHPSWT